MSLLRGQFAPPNDRPSAAADTIAYLTYNGALEGRSQIRLIQADGSDDRLLFEVNPSEVREFYRPWDLVWSPDATELAFTSGHLDASFYVRDIYALTVDGKNLRRITNPPLPDRTSAYPSGVVELEVYPFTGLSTTWWAYVEGAAKAISWEDPGRWQRWKVTFPDVADYGDHDQYVVVRDLSEMSNTLPWCNYGQTARVNLTPGQLSLVPSQLPESGRSSQPCLYADFPQWSRDGKQISYLVSNHDVVSTAYTLWSAPATDGRPGERGITIGMVENQQADVTRMIRDPSDDDRFALMTDGPGGRLQRIFVGSMADPSTTSEIPATALCEPGAIWDCAYPMLTWEPDGSGFFYTTFGPNSTDPAVKEKCGEGSRACTELRHFDLNAMRFENLAVFKDKQLRSMSFAPDRRRLVMEVDTAETAVHDLWVHNLESGESKLLVPAAAGAVWSPKP